MLTLGTNKTLDRSKRFDKRVSISGKKSRLQIILTGKSVSVSFLYPVSVPWQALAGPVKAVKSEVSPGLLSDLLSSIDFALYPLFHVAPDSYAPTLYLVIASNFK